MAQSKKAWAAIDAAYAASQPADLEPNEPTGPIELTTTMILAGWTQRGNLLIAPEPILPRSKPNPFLAADGTIDKAEYDRWIDPINDYLRRKAAAGEEV